MKNLSEIKSGDQNRILGMSTFAFTICFAVWTIFSILGMKIKANLGLSDTQFGVLVATPVLTGSISRIFLGIWTDQYGGRFVFTVLMILTSFATWLLTLANSYEMFLLAALGVGLAGGSFAVGIAYVSTWYPKKSQGTALGIFGVGNVGAAVTNFGAPFLLLVMDWEGVAKVYAAVLFITAIIFYLNTDDDPALIERRKSGKKPDSILKQIEPLKNLQVWRFSLYYFFVFGGFVALALWLPRFYVGAYGLELKTAGMLAAAYALPGSVFRALGGWMSDKWGARTVMYWTFFASMGACFILSYPATKYVIDGIDGPIDFTFAVDLKLFVFLTIVLGFFMSLGKAAVYKHIPAYYPNNVGSVGGMVGLIGGLGGFCMPILFGILNDKIGIWTSCFMLLFGVVSVSLIWMHLAISDMDREKHPDYFKEQDLP